MNRPSATAEQTIERLVFEAWSVEVPAAFVEDFDSVDDYWHAYDEHRSVSLTSVFITEDGHPVSAARILRRMRTMLEGSPVDQMPPGLPGIAVIAAVPQPARASRVLSGLLATDGHLLVSSITSDDLEWALRVWLSIRSHPAPL